VITGSPVGSKPTLTPILSELDRVRGTRVTLTLDIDAEAAEGFPEDVESVVRGNAASLRITDFGFEGE
jgi:hypothetical protein